ncbi:MAG: hypothetical protein RIQ34_824 [Bacteroidota bacterium]
MAARQAFNLFITPRIKVTKPLPSIFEQAEKLELIDSGNRCTGWRWNAGGHTRILILHGFSSSARNFAHIIADLVKRGAEVIAFDAPAHGASEGKSIHSLRYRQFIQQIRQQWGPVDGYIAHSFGGLSISLALEEMAPRQTEKLVLIAPATETRSALDQLRSTLSLRPNIMKQIDRLIEIKSGHPVAWFSVNRVVAQLSIPILWIHDASDEITPLADTAPTRERKSARVQFRITEGLGHRRVYRDQSVCQEILDFLTPGR